MQKLSQQQRKSLEAAVSRYHAALPGSPAEKYLVSRGLEGDELARYRFGFVEDPLPEHEMHRGKLAIPYLRNHPRHGWSCVSIRFRALTPEQKPKYATMAGDRPRIYNTQALTVPSLEVGITEGEIDAVTATLAGLPSVGLPGANSWTPYWEELFRGYRTVWIITDGDEPGEKLGRQLAKSIPNSKVIPCPPGEDANSVFTKHGAEALQALWGGNKE